MDLSQYVLGALFIGGTTAVVLLIALLVLFHFTLPAPLVVPLAFGLAVPAGLLWGVRVMVKVYHDWN